MGKPSGCGGEGTCDPGPFISAVIGGIKAAAALYAPAADCGAEYIDICEQRRPVCRGDPGEI